MKIATFNVNGVNGRLARLIEWLRETSPDVVCLQEIKTTDAKCPAAAIAAAGYGSIWHGQRAHHGVAILARGDAPREIRRGLPGGLREPDLNADLVPEGGGDHEKDQQQENDVDQRRQVDIRRLGALGAQVHATPSGRTSRSPLMTSTRFRASSSMARA